MYSCTLESSCSKTNRILKGAVFLVRTENQFKSLEVTNLFKIPFIMLLLDKACVQVKRQSTNSEVV